MPKAHLHSGYDILWDEDTWDYCVCRVCEQEWKLTPNGWLPIELSLNSRPATAPKYANKKKAHWAPKKSGSLNRSRKK